MYFLDAGPGWLIDKAAAGGSGLHHSFLPGSTLSPVQAAAIQLEYKVRRSDGDDCRENME